MSCHVHLRRILGGSLIILTAQAVASPSDGGLTLKEALTLASERHPRLLAEAESARAARGRVEQAGLPPDPTLDVSLENFAGSGPLDGFDSAEATVRASQLIERGGKRGHRVALATSERELADAAYAVSLSEARAATAATYVNLLVARERLSLSAEMRGLAADGATDAAARIDAGAASPVETVRGRVAIALADAAVARDRVAVDAARAALAAQWGGVADELGEISGTLGVPDEPPAPDALLAGLADHPRLAWERARLANRRAGLRLEQSRAVPDVSVGAGVRFFNDGRDAALVAGFSMPIPVRNRNQGNIGAARADLAGAEQSVKAAEIELRTAFGAAWGELRAARAAAASLRDEALPAARHAHQLLHDAYQRGEATLVEVLDARRELAGVRRDLLDAEAACAAALVRIDALTNPDFPLTSRLLLSK